jgi:hypothetical protein
MFVIRAQRNVKSTLKWVWDIAGNVLRLVESVPKHVRKWQLLLRFFDINLRLLFVTIYVRFLSVEVCSKKDDIFLCIGIKISPKWST